MTVCTIIGGASVPPEPFEPVQRQLRVGKVLIGIEGTPTNHSHSTVPSAMRGQCTRGFVQFCPILSNFVDEPSRLIARDAIATHQVRYLR